MHECHARSVKIDDSDDCHRHMITAVSSSPEVGEGRKDTADGIEAVDHGVTPQEHLKRLLFEPFPRAPRPIASP